MVEQDRVAGTSTVYSSNLVSSEPVLIDVTVMRDDARTLVIRTSSV